MKEINFEQRIDKAKEILEKLMNPEITLSNSVEHYKNGMNELQIATKLLQEAELKFEEYQHKDNKS